MMFGQHQRVNISFLPRTLRSLRPPQPTRPRRGNTFRTASLRIDRRRHFEHALQRQNAEEQRIQTLLKSTNRGVIEIRSLDQLDTVIDRHESALIVLFLYSRSCGSCKTVLNHYRGLCTEHGQASARVVFLKHDVYDDFDHLTDITRMYNVHAVPAFLFLSGGALMQKLHFRDFRLAAGNLPRQLVQDRQHLGDAIRRHLFKLAPSASH